MYCIKSSEKYSWPVLYPGNLIIDFVRHIVTLNNHKINLTDTEYRILCCLAQNTDRVLTPDHILRTVWGDEHAENIQLLQVNMTQLRQKLQNNSANP